MNSASFDFARMRTLLRRRADDAAVIELAGRDPAQIERSAYLGFVNVKPAGVAIVFAEAPWVVPAAEIADPKALHVSAFHLYREGHEGFAGYPGQLPNGVALGDAEDEVISKMGQPTMTGGGGISAVLKRPVPRWLRYPIGDANLQFQLDTSGRVEMATVSAPDVQEY